MFINITSKENKIIKHIKKLKQVKYRKKCNQFLTEGFLVSKEAILYASESIKFIIISDIFLEKNLPFMNQIKEKFKIYTVAEKIFNKICDTKNSQGIITIINKKSCELNLLKYNFLLILDSIANPGNMGAILRTAEASGIEAVIITNNCTDVYNSKVSRCSMGSLFKINIFELSDLNILINNGYNIIISSSHEGKNIYEEDFSGKIALVIGNETKGVSVEIKKISKNIIKIPMFGSIESLNAAQAATLITYFAKFKRMKFI
ncbi:MAG: RNA methyltransferase [Clostridiales bacterium]|jgi:TrmH family RNA methyltransferase|nr:RNA methyltransferase [Clostridiales bacterium]